MKKQQKKSQKYVDTVAQDFKRAMIVVSFGANLIVFVTWLTYVITNS